MLTRRWAALRAIKEQQEYWNSPYRFNVVPAGRRSGKTELAKRKLIKRALRGTNFYPPRFFAAAPTYNQAKRIYWDDLKALVPKNFLATKPSETDLMLKLVNGSEIYVLGMDKPERIEGQPWDGGILDEFGNMKPNAWGANVRPALSDRTGWCDLIGVPEGRNHYYDIHNKALASMLEFGAQSEWGAFTWKSSLVLPAAEIEAARRDLDELTFLQEYEASFVNFTGRAYYTFDIAEHCGKLRYDENAPLIFCFDFNVAPGIAAVAQEQALPGKYHEVMVNGVLRREQVVGTGWIGEVWIPNNSNTQAVCRKLIADWGEHKGRVICYGDATGGARGSAKIEGSDWDLIKGALSAHFGDRVRFKNQPANPPERARVNAVNTRFKTQDGTVRMMVDPYGAPHLVKDFEGVRVLEGGSGELDKKSDPKLTHISDAAGYYVVQEFPIIKQSLEVRTLSGF